MTVETEDVWHRIIEIFCRFACERANFQYINWTNNIKQDMASFKSKGE